MFDNWETALFDAYNGDEWIDSVGYVNRYEEEGNHDVERETESDC